MSRFTSISSIVQRHYERQHHERRLVRHGQPVIQKIVRDPKPVAEWSDGKLMAILMILRSATAKDCIAHWSGSGVRASQDDFRDLRQEGLAFKRELARFHELTDDGQQCAAVACVIVAKRLGLHHIETRSVSDSVAAKCTCGWRASYHRKYGNETSQLEGAINRHLRDPQEWQRTRERVDAEMAKVLHLIEASTTGGSDG